ncbi:bifunctional phosphopantothenoylcysteine decarboxylase/phosphopantothenate--cysteine ligase CoaBC [Rothia nasimurium]|uniref:Coenzyme A biosynthesis bifunctional protein CoaBC n=1 Tax=Rothia nasimurium TaxID=85336 RepID=A0A4Y9F4K1_9MICC|nr:bifunctional phosphopantothenoylcysteine decarboxylase/phosphopantothenate--cysteine ligase CoaBC [Rothia nasimurium]MBF0807821.1 bifunctional phosphopantothenoylcysteine decarboxylase/phosphopantothenate--cysteine ligase CoaBC [Rothia nasimurium]TFU23024.1 bifunctional phosphopantothenoylcysteine decarboxylase/phosphopantothenate--cysteine ligase CoaBC [Rothia nasimurium]
MRVVIGIGGGIAAYKAAMLLRLFGKAGHEVIAVPTEAALKFVGQPTLEALSGNPVSVDVFERVPEVNHVQQAERADAVIIAPATADLMARLAAGRANDLLTATVLTTHAPVILAPAMHTQMWEHPATQANVATLKSYGYHIIEPAVGRLTGPDSGVGRLPEPEDIYAQALSLLGWNQDAVGEGQSVEAGGLPLAGQRLLITAGGTREALDPVRFLGNRSSGKQGIALATAATELGAQVHLIAAHVEVEIPGNLHRVTRVSSALQLREAVFEHLAATDVLIMTAAVADFRPVEYADAKIKKTDDPGQDPVIRLVRNPDVLKEAVLYREENPQRAPHTIVGFAAETGDATTSPLNYGRAKLARKGCDYLAVNTVSETQGFGADSNTITLLSGQNDREVPLQGSKLDVSRAILRHIAQEFNNHSPSSPTEPREVQ